MLDNTTKKPEPSRAPVCKYCALRNDVDKLKRAVLFLDIDGVLANIDHRLGHYAEKDWGQFYGCSMADDEKHVYSASAVAMILGLKHLYADNFDLIIVTSRPERTRTITVLWLEHHFPALIAEELPMLMREDGDYRPSAVVKWENIKDVLLDASNHETLGDTDYYFLDDNPRNIREVCAKADELDYLNGQVNMFGLTVGTRLLGLAPNSSTHEPEPEDTTSSEPSSKTEE